VQVQHVPRDLTSPLLQSTLSALERFVSQPVSRRGMVSYHLVMLDIVPTLQLLLRAMVSTIAAQVALLSGQPPPEPAVAAAAAGQQGSAGSSPVGASPAASARCSEADLEGPSAPEASSMVAQQSTAGQQTATTVPDCFAADPKPSGAAPRPPTAAPAVCSTAQTAHHGASAVGSPAAAPAASIPLSISEATLSVSEATLSISADTLSVGKATLSISADTLSVGKATLSISEDTLSVGEATLSNLDAPSTPSPPYQQAPHAAGAVGMCHAACEITSLLQCILQDTHCGARTEACIRAVQQLLSEADVLLQLFQLGHPAASTARYQSQLEDTSLAPGSIFTWLARVVYEHTSIADSSGAAERMEPVLRYLQRKLAAYLNEGRMLVWLDRLVCCNLFAGES
jgi:hypothetical protein